MITIQASVVLLHSTPTQDLAAVCFFLQYTLFIAINVVSNFVLENVPKYGDVTELLYDEVLYRWHVVAG